MKFSMFLKKPTVIAIFAITVFVGLFLSWPEKQTTLSLWQPGYLYRYSLDMTMVSHQYPSLLSTKESDVSLKLIGHVDFNIPAEYKQKGEVSGQLTISDFTYSYNDLDIIPKAFIRNIIPFKVSYLNGKIHHYNIAEADKKYKDIIREVLVFWDIKQPNDKPMTWYDNEVSPKVSYPIMLQLNSPLFFGDNELAVSYLPLTVNEDYSGVNKYKFNNQEVKSLKVDRKRVYKMSGELTSVSNTVMTSDLMSKSSYQTAFNPKVKLAYQDDLMGSTQQQEQFILRQEAALADDSPEDVFKFITTITERKKIGDGTSKVIALLALHPEQLDNVMQLLEELDLYDLRFDMIISALRYLGTPEIQIKLISKLEALNNESDFIRKNQYLSAVAYVEKPVAESYQYFSDEFVNATDSNMKTKAAFGLGIISSNIEDQNLANAAAQELMQQYDFSSKREKIVILRALSNAGSLESEIFVFDLIEDNDKDIAIKAIAALRKIDTQASKEKLSTLLTDKQRDYRLAAAQSLQEHTIVKADIPLLQSRLEDEPDPSIQRVLLKTVTSYEGDKEVINKVLNSYLTTCFDYQLCNYAKSALLNNK